MMLVLILQCTFACFLFAITNCVTICISTLSGISNNYAKTSPFVLTIGGYLRSSSAALGSGAVRRKARYEGKQKMLLLQELFGFGKTCLLEIDDRNINEEAISDALNGASMVYIDGINFWNIAKKYPNFLLIGASAGGIVTGKSIATSYYKGWDDPGVVSGHTWNPNNLSGSCSLPYLLFMHYNETIHRDLVIQKTKEYAATRDITVCLQDNHALIHDGSDVRILDENGKVVIHENRDNIWFPR